MITTVRLANGGGGVAETAIGTPIGELPRNLAPSPRERSWLAATTGAWLPPSRQGR